MNKRIIIELPEEFIALCEADGAAPETVIRGFIADLAEIMNWQRNPREDGHSSDNDERDWYCVEQP